jgi:hypothetical protein
MFAGCICGQAAVRRAQKLDERRYRFGRQLREQYRIRRGVDEHRADVVVGL